MQRTIVAFIAMRLDAFAIDQFWYIDWKQKGFLPSLKKELWNSAVGPYFVLRDCLCWSKGWDHCKSSHLQMFLKMSQILQEATCIGVSFSIWNIFKNIIFHSTTLVAASSHILNVVSASFLLISFVCLKDSTCETRKNVFYCTSKALFLLEIIKFLLLRYSNVMTSSNAQAWNTKHILLNNLGSEESLVMKFGQFI